MANAKQPPESEVSRLLGEHYEEAHVEAAFRTGLLDRTRWAVTARARSRYRFALAAAAGAALLLAVFAVQVRNQGLTPPLTGATASGKARVVLITVRGDVQDGRGHALKVGDQLAAGATVRTGKASYLVMVTRKGSGLALDAKSELTVARDGKSVALRKGQVYCRNWKHEFAAVTTPAGEIHLLGTVIDASVKSRREVAVTVVEGKVKLANAHGTAVVPAGRKAMLIASAAPGEGAAANVLAETAWVEGTLYYRAAERFGAGWSDGGTFQALTGSIQTEEAMPSADAQPSPVSDNIVWSDEPDDGIDLHPTRRSVLVQRCDGTNVNLTERAGISGLNCRPRWSPDGTMIAFQHCDASGERLACQEGFHAWVMEADGSNARPLTPAEGPSTKAPVWMPDGRHLLVQVENSGAMYRVGLDGGPMEQLPGVVEDPVWSPDGRWMACSAEVGGKRDGRPGVWRQLVLADALGNNRRVLVRQFIATADAALHYPTAEQKEKDPERDWIEDLRYWVGPTLPQWSPDGTQLAFLAALPFDPEGPYYREQVRVWIYDLEARRLVQATYEAIGGVYALVWNRSEAAGPAR